MQTSLKGFAAGQGRDTGSVYKDGGGDSRTGGSGGKDQQDLIMNCMCGWEG
jgi:hypothetical protein